MNATRLVQPEILDALPPEAAGARASRRDLRLLNRLLGSEAWFKKSLFRHRRDGERILEIGAGSGELSAALQENGYNVAALDRCPRPDDWPASRAWLQSDVFQFSAWADYPVVIANLFLHHLDAAGLQSLGGELTRHARLIVANEPLRTRRTAGLFALVCPLLRAHPVTRYDGRVSIAAGFRGDELARRLGLDPHAWRWHAQETLLGCCRLVAERRA